MNLVASDSEQTVIGAPGEIDPQYRALEYLHWTNCIHTAWAHDWHKRSDYAESPDDARHAALVFMMAATPKQEVMYDIATRYEELVESIHSTFETRLIGSSEVAVEYLHDVPDTVNPVKINPAYVQVPDGDSTALHLVWKVRCFFVSFSHSY